MIKFLFQASAMARDEDEYEEFQDDYEDVEGECDEEKTVATKNSKNTMKI